MGVDIKLTRFTIAKWIASAIRANRLAMTEYQRFAFDSTNRVGLR